MCTLLIVMHFYDSLVAFHSYLEIVSDNPFKIPGKASINDPLETVSALQHLIQSTWAISWNKKVAT